MTGDSIDFVKHSTDGIDFRPHASGPQKSPQDFFHLSDSDVKDGVLHGSRRGSSPDASDAHRIHVGPGAPSALHVYRSGAVAHAQIAKRKHLHRISGSFAISDIATDPTFSNALNSAYATAKQAGLDDATANASSINSAEHALKAGGYDGYTNSKDVSGHTILFGDHAIVR